MTPLRTPESTPPTELQSFVRAQLQPSERITWFAQPIPARAARKLLPVFPLSIVVIVAASVGWSKFDVVKRFSEPVQTAVAIVYVAVVLSFAAASLLPYFWLRRSARRVAYVATDRRCLIVRTGGWKGNATQSYEPRQLANLELVQNRDVSGDIVFERREFLNSDSLNTMESVGFLAIPNVRMLRRPSRASGNL